MNIQTKFKEKILLGKVDGKSIFLSPPSWDCGWYWGFGYLGNRNCHYHVSNIRRVETYNFDKSVWQYEFLDFFEGLKRHFDSDTFILKEDSNIWKLAELFATFYTLKESTEVLGRGGSHLCSNPLSDIIKNPDEVKRLNEVVLPQIFDAIYNILTNENHV